MLYCFVSSTARTARSIVRILRVASSPLLVEKYQVPIDVLGVGSEAYRVGQKSVASIMVDGNGATDVRRRIGKQVAVRLGQRQIDIGFRRSGTKAGRFLELKDRLRLRPAAAENRSVVHVGVVQIRVETEGRTILGDGPLVVPASGQYGSEIVVQAGIVRLLFDRPFEFAPRLIEISPNESQPAQNIGLRRLVRRAAKKLFSLRCPPSRQLDRPERPHRFSTIRIGGDCSFSFHRRLIESPLAR